MNKPHFCQRKVARTHFQSWLIVGLLAQAAPAQVPLELPVAMAPASSVPTIDLSNSPEFAKPPALPLAHGLKHLPASAHTQKWSAKEHASWILGLRTRSPLAQAVAVEPVASPPMLAATAVPSVPASIASNSNKPAPVAVPVLPLPSLPVPPALSPSEPLAAAPALDPVADRPTAAPTAGMVIPVQYVLDGLPEVPEHARALGTAASSTVTSSSVNAYGSFAFAAEEPVRAGNGPVLGAPATPIPLEPLSDSPASSLLDVDLSGVDPKVAAMPQATTQAPQATTQAPQATTRAPKATTTESLIDGLDLSTSKKPAVAHSLSDSKTSANKPASITIHESFAPPSRGESAKLSLSDNPRLETPQAPNLKLDGKPWPADGRPTSEAPFRPGASARAAQAIESQASSLATSVSNSAMKVSTSPALPEANGKSSTNNLASQANSPLSLSQREERPEVPALPLVSTAPRLDPSAIPELPPSSFAVNLSDKSDAANKAIASDQFKAAESKRDDGKSGAQLSNPPKVTAALSDKESPAPIKPAIVAKVEPARLDEMPAGEPPKLVDHQSAATGETAPPLIPQKAIAAEAPPSSQPIVAAQRMKLPDPTLPSAIQRSRPAVTPASATSASVSSPVANSSSDDERSFANLAAQMQQEVKQKFPASRVKVSSHEEGLVVTGMVNDTTEASKILAFIRKSSLCPVVDRVQSQR